MQSIHCWVCVVSVHNFLVFFFFFQANHVPSDLNIHLDTPMEILHTILLGVVKYFWGQSVYILKKAKLLTIFQSRLDSINCDGLNVPSLNAEYIC